MLKSIYVGTRDPRHLRPSQNTPCMEGWGFRLVLRGTAGQDKDQAAGAYFGFRSRYEATRSITTPP